MKEAIVGIDLGTTNSEVAIVRDGTPEVIVFEGEAILPSVVGLSPSGELLVGTPARNQLAAYPERTVRSIKRRMGSDEKVKLGHLELTPPEVSALILKELMRRARAVTGLDLRKAVITVPAFFLDAQRQATRAAGEIAGIEVVRILNEPTAAALAFEGERGRERLLAVYDLGGGTFDVSVVRTDGELCEVLASHGDTALGGDDFDRLLAEEIAKDLIAKGHPDPQKDRVLEARLVEAAEAAKRRLTEEVFTRVREEFFGSDRTGKPLHVDVEVTRTRYEELIAPLVERTLDSVHEAVRRAQKTLGDIDDILLVGGATRTPLVGHRLREIYGQEPRRDVHPDLCVALGAAIQAARIAGDEVGRVLIDVTPYSFGPRCVGELDGEPSEWFCPKVIERGTPLPVTRSESFYTMHDAQELWDVEIYQGESFDARDNVRIGRFMATGFSDRPEGNEILCRMSLDLDGILRVEVIEKCTGHKKEVRIEGAAARMAPAEIEASQQRTAALYAAEDTGEPDSDEPVVEIPRPSIAPWVRRLDELMGRAARLESRMADEDRQELLNMRGEAADAIGRGDAKAGEVILQALENLVHYVEEA